MTVADRPKQPGGRAAGQLAGQSGGAAREAGAAFTLTPRPPFDWGYPLRFLAGSPATHTEQVVEGDHAIKAWRTAEASVVTRIGRAPDAPALTVELVSAEPVTEATVETMADRLRFFLSLDDDLATFARAAAGDPAFAPIEARCRGYRQVKFPTPVESLVWSILTQRTPAQVARKIQSRLMRELTPPVTGFGHELQPFPSLGQLAAPSEAELAGVIGNQRKAAHLYGSVQRLAEVDESFLRHGDYDEVKAFLLALPGIGPWSASSVMVRGLGRMERLPEDPAVLEAAQRAYHRTLAMGDLETLSARYAPYPGYWAHYLRIAE
jgi:DNA-3-methyladenine glycosylase II